MGKKDAFSEFEDNIQKRDSSAQILYEYEKHYMNLLEKHSDDIQFIYSLLKECREEQETMTEKLVLLNQKLDEQGVDEQVKNIWLQHLADNMSRSFKLSNDMIEHFVVSELGKFKMEIKKRINQ